MKVDGFICEKCATGIKGKVYEVKVKSFSSGKNYTYMPFGGVVMYFCEECFFDLFDGAYYTDLKALFREERKQNDCESYIG